MNHFSRLFASRKPIIGVVHLSPLPGYPEHPGMDTLIAQALADVDILQHLDVDGVLIENEYDRPHRVRATAEVIAAMTRVTRAVVEASRGIVVGCEILLNDPVASLAVAAASGARFIRTDYFVDRMSRPGYGEFAIDPEGLVAYRDGLGSDLSILADIQVKFATMLDERPLSESARLACRHRADAIVVTGPQTGDPPCIDDLRAAATGAAESGMAVPVLIGSGLDEANATALLRHCDGAIVGSSLMQERRIDAGRTRALMCQVRKVLET